MILSVNQINNTKEKGYFKVIYIYSNGHNLKTNNAIKRFLLI